MASGALSPLHVSLLRGINVGGHAKVPMAWLRTAYESVGCADVKTHLQSGNVVFRRVTAPAEVGGEVAQLIKAELGFEPAILHRTHEELAAIVADDPFPEADPSRRLVVFLSTPLSAEAARSLDDMSTERETLLVGPRELQLNLPDGIGRSKLAEALAKKRLDAVATARNWRTVTKLVELSAPQP